MTATEHAALWQPIATAPRDGTEVMVYEGGAIPYFVLGSARAPGRMV